MKYFLLSIEILNRNIEANQNFLWGDKEVVGGIVMGAWG